MRVYKSKISYGLFIPVVAVNAILCITLLIDGLWLFTAFMLLILAFIVDLFKRTFYTIDGNILKIQSGILVKMEIPIDSIFKIKETSNPMSAPATSMDRLELKYNENSFVLISPAEKQEFIDEITSINPNIEVTYKKNRQKN